MGFLFFVHVYDNSHQEIKTPLSVPPAPRGENTPERLQDNSVCLFKNANSFTIGVLTDILQKVTPDGGFRKWDARDDDGMENHYIFFEGSINNNQLSQFFKECNNYLSNSVFFECHKIYDPIKSHFENVIFTLDIKHIFPRIEEPTFYSSSEKKENHRKLEFNNITFFDLIQLARIFSVFTFFVHPHLVPSELYNLINNRKGSDILERIKNYFVSHQYPQRNLDEFNLARQSVTSNCETYKPILRPMVRRIPLISPELTPPYRSLHIG